MSAKVIGGLCIVAAGLVLTSCSMFDPDRWGNQGDPDAQRRAEDPYHTDPKYADPDSYNSRTMDGKEQPSLMGMLFGSGKSDNSTGSGGAGVAVNSFLWRASLDTVSFMPLASADPFGGTIITDWYSPAATPDERFKVNVFILGRDLRADGIRARVFRQKKDPAGQWADQPVDQTTGTDIENAILTRARQIRLSTASNQ